MDIWLHVYHQIISNNTVMTNITSSFTVLFVVVLFIGKAILYCNVSAELKIRNFVIFAVCNIIFCCISEIYRIHTFSSASGHHRVIFNLNYFVK